MPFWQDKYVLSVDFRGLYNPQGVKEQVFQDQQRFCRNNTVIRIYQNSIIRGPLLIGVFTCLFLYYFAIYTPYFSDLPIHMYLI